MLLKVAVTAYLPALPALLGVHVRAVPVQEPLQPLNVQPLAGAAAIV